MKNGIYRTFVLGEDGIVYDLAEGQYLPQNVMALNAWTELIQEAQDEYTKIQSSIH